MRLQGLRPPSDVEHGDADKVLAIGVRHLGHERAQTAVHVFRAIIVVRI